MPIRKCPKCNNKLKLFDLWAFRLKGYKIKCASCNSEFNLNGSIDQLGIILFALLAMGLFGVFAVFMKILSKYFIFSKSIEIVFIVLIIVFISAFIIYGHAAYLAWNIKRKYQKEHKEM